MSLFDIIQVIPNPIYPTLLVRVYFSKFHHQQQKLLLLSLRVIMTLAAGTAIFITMLIYLTKHYEILLTELF